LGPAGLRFDFRGGEEAEPRERVGDLLRIGRVRPGFSPDPRDRLGIETAQIGGLFRGQPAPSHHCLGAALFQRRVIEIRVGPRGERFQRERRGFGKITGDHAQVAGFEPPQQPLETFDVHRVGEAVGDRLAHQGVVGHLALADQILGARDLVRKNRCDQIFGVHAGKLRGHLATAAKPRERQRHASDPAPARIEHRRVEHGLDQQRLDAA